jgi:gluconolactonase
MGEGRPVTCEHLGRRVSRTEHVGTVTILSHAWQDKRLTSPNDVVVPDDGAVRFTYPTYGIDNDHESAVTESEFGASHLYRIDPISGDDTLGPSAASLSSSCC